MKMEFSTLAWDSLNVSQPPLPYQTYLVFRDSFHVRRSCSGDGRGEEPRSDWRRALRPAGKPTRSEAALDYARCDALWKTHILPPQTFRSWR